MEVLGRASLPASLLFQLGGSLALPKTFILSAPLSHRPLGGRLESRQCLPIPWAPILNDPVSGAGPAPVDAIAGRASGGPSR